MLLPMFRYDKPLLKCRKILAGKNAESLRQKDHMVIIMLTFRKSSLRLQYRASQVSFTIIATVDAPILYWKRKDAKDSPK